MAVPALHHVLHSAWRRKADAAGCNTDSSAFSSCVHGSTAVCLQTPWLTLTAAPGRTAPSTGLFWMRLAGPVGIEPCLAAPAPLLKAAALSVHAGHSGVAAWSMTPCLAGEQRVCLLAVLHLPECSSPAEWPAAGPLPCHPEPRPALDLMGTQCSHQLGVPLVPGPR